MAKKKIVVEDIVISLNKEGYISLTDIAKKSSDSKPIVLIRRWLRTQKTLSFLYAWEEAHNSNFKVSQKGYFRDLIEDNSREVSPAVYIKELGGIGMVSTSGRYGGTYAHSDIALDFCRWIDPRFAVWVNKEFQRLKNEEAKRLGLEFDLRRELTKANYPLHTDAIKKYLVTPKADSKKKRLVYANEADLLNVVLFGCTAKDWKTNNPAKKGNIRDHATIEELMILANIEFLNGKLIASLQE